jgi:hypothetical protein
MMRYSTEAIYPPSSVRTVHAVGILSRLLRVSCFGARLAKAYLNAATLYSSAHEILETKVVRFEWSVPEEEERMAGTDLTRRVWRVTR